MTQEMTEAPGYDANTEELAKFRNAWVAEVRQRKGTSGASVAGASSPGSHEEPLHKSPPISPTKTSTMASSFTRSRSPEMTRSQQKARLTHTTSTHHMSKSMEKALDIYRRAIIHEQAGNLDEALGLYRSAFRLESHVDKAYSKEELRLQLVGRPSDEPDIVTRMHKLETAESAKSTQLVDDRSKAAGQHAKTSSLAKVIAQFPDDVDFTPEDERKAILLSQLPDELLVSVLRLLEPRSVERFAQVARKARLLTLDPSIWRPLVYRTYIPPQVSEDIVLDELVNTYNFDYRKLYIEHPRLRLDGVYIAVCHYVRPGLSENAWVNISHLITYHRYLRFFADGTVVSLLANEEMSPQTIVPMLTPKLRLKGCLVGTWTLEGHMAVVRDLIDTSSNNVRYSFQMLLDLRSRPLGRWNKLEINGYESVHLETGENVPLSLKHERPFWFSKVRSYA